MSLSRALAISLRDLAPHLRIALADAGRESPFRIGESVPPPIKPWLDHLGLGTLFGQDGHAPTFRTYSAWGQPELIGNEFFLYVHNTGWRLDRARFDRMLRTQAERRGAITLTAAVAALAPEENSWRIGCGPAGTMSARFVVDATGRRAALSRLLGLKPVRHDRLLACAVFFEQREPADWPGADAAVVEACRDGWWYTVALPEGHRVAMLMSDTDLARLLRVSRYEAWRECVAKTRYMQPLLAGARPLSPPLFWPAASRHFGNAPQVNRLAVGDALSSFDPLSSQGIVKALRSAVFASYAIADRFLREDESGMARYHALARREFASYLVTRRDYYRREQRWPDAPFWRRRQ
jgi:flavin-dependent dehydrogenase